jgi:hypothetical protein
VGTRTDRVKVSGGDKDRQHKTTQDYKPEKNGPHFSPPTLCLSLFSFPLVTTLFSSSPTPIFICLLDWCFFFFLYVADCGEITTFAFNFQVFAFSFLFFFSCGW